jgi:hypothetical protein
MENDSLITALSVRVSISIVSTYQGSSNIGYERNISYWPLYLQLTDGKPMPQADELNKTRVVMKL